MENNSETTTSPPSPTTSSLSPSSISSSSPSPPLSLSPVPVASPCAACKILRRRCAEKCVLAPYFPPTDPLKFTTAHRVFGASNIIKLLQELPERQRADAVSSMVYEANARLRDPVYGCAGTICHLQKQISDLQAQLAKSQAQIITMQSQQANLVAFICMEMAGSPQSSPEQQQQHEQQQQQQQQQCFDDFIASPQSFNTLSFLEENMWEPLWT